MHTTSPALAALGLALAGCTAMEAGDPMPPASMDGACEAGPGQSLIGDKASDETGARALSLTGARTLRWGPPGAIFTMDYREDRVNVIYDANMIITEVRCG